MESLVGEVPGGICRSIGVSGVTGESLLLSVLTDICWEERSRMCVLSCVELIGCSFSEVLEAGERIFSDIGMGSRAAGSDGDVCKTLRCFLRRRERNSCWRGERVDGFVSLSLSITKFDN
jgi:hypothetical protein